MFLWTLKVQLACLVCFSPGSLVFLPPKNQHVPLQIHIFGLCGVKANTNKERAVYFLRKPKTQWPPGRRILYRLNDSACL